MENNQTYSPDFNDKRQGKGKDFVLQIITQIIEKNTGKSISELKTELSEDKLFFECLMHITTTKKAICEAVEIPIEAGCRYKRKFEKTGLLVASADAYVCPYTKHKANLISTNPAEFDRLRKSKNENQLTLF